MMGNIRPAAVAGRFYPDDEAELARQVQSFMPSSKVKRRAVGIMVPHAGYVYSGGVAGQVFAGVEVPETAIVLCPNHTGRGTSRIAVLTSGVFRIPGAEVAIDEELATAIVDTVPGAAIDPEAHRFEHAIEVELPFLVARNPDVRIVPIVLSGLSEADAIALGTAMHQLSSAMGRDVLVVASSDMSHYLPDEVCRRIDEVALDPLLRFDPEGLYRTVESRDISMCGYIPATAMLSFARAAGAQMPELDGYATSGDAFGDRSRVVGYAGVIVPA